MNLEPGDKVSFINDKLNGTVKYRIDKQSVMLELEDGFDLPAKVSELVMVKKLRESALSKAQGPELLEAAGAAAELAEALYLAFALEKRKIGDAYVYLSLINNTPYHFVHLLFDVNSKAFDRFYKGNVAPYTTTRIAFFSFRDIDDHKNWQCRFFYFNESMKELPPPVEFDHKLKPANLLRSEEIPPGLSLPGLIVPIPLHNEVRLQETVSHPKNEVLSKPPEVVDLHAEYILGEKVKDKQGLLDMQLLYFRNNLEKGIAVRMEKITFIHGIGNGVLKRNMISLLDDYEAVARWEEADYKIYGYGATTVYFKTR